MITSLAVGLTFCSTRVSLAPLGYGRYDDACKDNYLENNLICPLIVVGTKRLDVKERRE